MTGCSEQQKHGDAVKSFPLTSREALCLEVQCDWCLWFCYFDVGTFCKAPSHATRLEHRPRLLHLGCQHEWLEFVGFPWGPTHCLLTSAQNSTVHRFRIPTLVSLLGYNCHQRMQIICFHILIDMINYFRIRICPNCL